MHSTSIIQALVGWFLLLGHLPEMAAAAAAAVQHDVVSDSSPALTSTLTLTSTLSSTERNGATHVAGSEQSQHDSDGSILLRASEDATADHCITSADCAFNGECVKQSDDGTAHNDYSNNNYNNSNVTNSKKIDPEAPGNCACFAGWKGRTCEVLDLLPVDPQKVGLVLPNRDSSTWGGSVVYHEVDGIGLYHMFASEILYNCGLYSWTTNSQVIRAVSESPFGPYEKVQVILPPFAHDANIIRAPTGEFVLFVTARKGVKPKDCRQPRQNQTRSDSIQRRRYLRDAFEESSNSTTTTEDKVPPKDTYMLWAPEPEGPWSEPIMVLNSTIYNSDYWKKHNKTAKCDSNLNGIILPSNNEEGTQSFLGLWRRCETDELLTIPHALVASDWRNASTYRPIVDHPLFVLAGSGAEDPSNIWTTRTSDGQVAYHVLFHDEQATRCMLGSCGGQGRHAVSLDGTTWRYASVNAYERHFSWEDSSSSSSLSSNHTTTSKMTRTATREDDKRSSQRVVRADTRARPHIILASDAGRGDPLQQTPIALSTGLKETDESGYVYTLVQPLRGEEGGLQSIRWHSSTE